MQNNYKQYIKPVLTELGNDARNELYGDVITCEYLKKMGRPVFCFYRKTQQEIMTNYLFWSIVCLYGRTEFFNPRTQNDMQNFKAIVKPGQEQNVRDAYEFMTRLPSSNINSRFKKLECLVKNARLERMTPKCK